jgi:hypothetical protein
MILLWSSEGEIEFSWRGLHRIGGWLIVFSVLPAVVGGLVTQYGKENYKWNTPRVLLFRKAHKYLTFACLILSIFVISLGFEMFLKRVAYYRHL